MARQQVDTAVGAEALRTVAGPRMQAVQVAADPGRSSAFQLAAALGKAEPVLEQFREDWERRKTIEQLAKKSSYVEQVRNDINNGGVTAVQLGQQFPEMVPTVRYQVLEAKGERDGKTAIQPIISEMLSDENLRYNTGARAEYLKSKRAQIMQSLGGDDFYKSGYLKAIDSELNQYENTLQRESAAMDLKILGEKFSTKVTEALMSQNPQAALETLDLTWKTTNGLSNQSRNEIVFETAKRLAFTMDNDQLLDQLPERFLNAQRKAEIADTKIKVMQIRMQKVRDAKTIRDLERDEQTRTGKNQILQSLVSNQPIDPYTYANNPELFEFALKTKDAPRLAEAVSVGNSQRVRTALLDSATAGGLDQNQLIDGVLANPNINPREKQKLIEEMPKLLEGRVSMQDERVKGAVTLRLDPMLKAIEQGPFSKLPALANLRGQTVNLFQQNIRNAFMSYYQQNGSFPTGGAIDEIVDKQIAAAETFANNQLKTATMGRAGATQGGSAPAAGTPAPATGVRRYNPATGRIE